MVAALDDPNAPEPVVVSSSTPIKALPDDVGTVVVARADAGLTPAGADFPRLPVLKRVARPSALLAVLDLILLIVALVTGNGLLAAVSAVLLVVFAAAAVLSVRYVAADPLRIGPREQRAIAASGRWSPSRAWPEPGHQRALIGAASAAAQRIVDTEAWRTGVLARSGVVLQLAAELDRTETATAQANDDAWPDLVTRVAALVAYADVAETVHVEDPSGDLEPREAEVLAFFLSGAIYHSA